MILRNAKKHVNTVAVNSCFLHRQCWTIHICMEPLFEQRHVLTRHSVHGFHHKLCHRTGCHNPSDERTFCGLVCTTYHHETCRSAPAIWTLGRSSDPWCAPTCDSFVRHICAAGGSNPKFCNARVQKFEDFACQFKVTQYGIVPLRPAERVKQCLSIPGCRSAWKLYPCLEGYVMNGSIVCAPACMLGNHSMESVSYRGHCIEITSSCVANIERFRQTIANTRLGYSYSDSIFNDKDLLNVSYRHSPGQTALLYPLMLSYAVLVDTTGVPVEPELEGKLAAQLGDEHNLEYLAGLYREDASLKSRVVALLRRYRYVSENATLRVLYLVSSSRCTVLDACPPLDKAPFLTWMRNSGPICTLARAMFAMSFPIGRDTEIRLLSNLFSFNVSAARVSLLYSTSFVSRLLDAVDAFNRATYLNETSFRHSAAMCANDSGSQWATESLVVPLPLARRLSLFSRGLPGQLDKFDAIYKYALVANDQGVQTAICGRAQRLPEVSCEIRMYLTFRAFLPEPNPQETAITGSNTTIFVYFTLRVILRANLFHRNPSKYPFASKEKDLTHQFPKAAKLVVESCLQRL